MQSPTIPDNSTNQEQPIQQQEQQTQQVDVTQSDPTQQQDGDKTNDTHEEVKFRKIFDITQLDGVPSFLALLENPDIRPLMKVAVKRIGNDKEVDIIQRPLHFTPNFANLIRFGEHPIVKSKYTYEQIEALATNDQGGRAFSHFDTAEEVETVMQAYIPHAILAEETLRQPEAFSTAQYNFDQLRSYQMQTCDALVLTGQVFGKTTLECEGTLFLHMSAIKHMEIDVPHRSLCYPPLKLSDRELDTLKLPLANEEIQKINVGLYYQQDKRLIGCYKIPEPADGSRYEDDFKKTPSIAGESIFMPKKREYDSEQIQDLVEMVKAMTKLQASLEVSFITDTNVKVCNYVKENENSEVLMDLLNVQTAVESHKMTILTGLAHLKRRDLKSFERVFEVLYAFFLADPSASQYAFGQVAVLMTGMGLVSECGRIAFFQAINQYCSTLLQLLYGETHDLQGSPSRKTVRQPTSGNAKIYQSRHESKLANITFEEGAVEQDKQDQYRQMLKHLTATPRRFTLVLGADLFSEFYQNVDKLQDFPFEIRSIPSLSKDDKPTSGKPSKRQYYAFKGDSLNPYKFLVDPNQQQEGDFFSSKKRYLAVSLNGGNVDLFELEDSAIDGAPNYYECYTDNYPIEDSLLRQIDGWLIQAYLGVEKSAPQNRSLDSDIRVLGEYQRQFLVNQDTTNIATSIEQIAFNHQSYNKLHNMLGRLAEEMIKSDLNKVLRHDIIWSSITMARLNQGDNVFYVDQMARAFLVCCQVLKNDNFLRMRSLLDHSIFDPQFTYTMLNDYGRKVISESPASLTPNKRVQKQKEKQLSSASKSNSAKTSPLTVKVKLQPGSATRKSKKNQNPLIRDFKLESNIILTPEQSNQDPSELQIRVETYQEWAQQLGGQESEEEDFAWDTAELKANDEEQMSSEDWMNIRALLDSCMDCSEEQVLKGLNEEYGYQPIRSAFIQFRRLEYFSVRQQLEFPVYYDVLGNEIAFIEAVVRDWMRVNNIRKVARLYEDSRVGEDDFGYYVTNSAQQAELLKSRGPIKLEQFSEFSNQSRQRNEGMNYGLASNPYVYRDANGALVDQKMKFETNNGEDAAEDFAGANELEIVDESLIGQDEHMLQHNEAVVQTDVELQAQFSPAQQMFGGNQDQLTGGHVQDGAFNYTHEVAQQKEVEKATSLEQKQLKAAETVQDNQAEKFNGAQQEMGGQGGNQDSGLGGGEPKTGGVE